MLLEHFDDVWGQLGDPVAIEQKFLELLPQAYALENKSIYLQIVSQLALVQAVLQKFEQAHAVLDQAEQLLTDEYQLAQVRILCERGRVFQQAGDIIRARIYFEKSYALSVEHAFDKQTINAAHMIAIVAPVVTEKIAWNCKALDLAMHSSDSAAQNWQGPIFNNLGANYLESGQLDKALDAFKKTVIAFDKSVAYTSNSRFARFKVAQVLRMLNQLDESLAMLQMHIQEYDAMTTAGKFDISQAMFVLMRGWLYEELTIVYALQNNQEQAMHYAQLALVDLEHNQLFMSTDQTYSDRIQKLRAF